MLENIIAVFKSASFPICIEVEGQGKNDNLAAATDPGKMKRIQKQSPEYDLFITKLRLISGVF